MSRNHPSRKLPPIAPLIKRLGGPSAVAEAIGRTHSAVCQWTRIPADHVPTLVAHSRRRRDPITAAQMRPDLWGDDLRRR